MYSVLLLGVVIHLHSHHRRAVTFRHFPLIMTTESLVGFIYFIISSNAGSFLAASSAVEESEGWAWRHQGCDAAEIQRGHSVSSVRTDEEQGQLNTKQFIIKIIIMHSVCFMAVDAGLLANGCSESPPCWLEDCLEDNKTSVSAEKLKVDLFVELRERQSRRAVNMWLI